jgi:hypothetical protein
MPFWFFYSEIGALSVRARRRLKQNVGSNAAEVHTRETQVPMKKGGKGGVEEKRRDSGAR